MLPKLPFAILLALGLAVPAGAEGISAAHKKLLEGRLAKQYRFSARLQPENAAIPRYAGSYRGEFFQIATAAARRHGVPEDLMARMIHRESRWNPKAVSHKGAIGLGQLMPETAATLGVDPTDPVANLDGSARYLRAQFDRFGSWRLALAAYNAGPEAVVAAGGIPEFAETQSYVTAILGR